MGSGGCGISERHIPPRSGAALGFGGPAAARICPCTSGSQGGKTAGKGHTHTHTLLWTILKVKNQPDSPELRKLGGRRASEIIYSKPDLHYLSIDEASEAQRGEMTSPRSHSSEPDFLILL